MGCRMSWFTNALRAHALARLEAAGLARRSPSSPERRPGGWSRRRGQAGVISVGALSYTGMATLMLVGTLFLNAVFDAKLDSLYKARVEAWQEALPGCEWSGVCNVPDLTGRAQLQVQDPNVSSWQASLLTTTTVSCNEPSRQQDDLHDAIGIFKREIAGVGGGGWKGLLLVDIFETTLGALRIGYEAGKCLYDIVKEVTIVDALVPVLAIAIDYVLGLIL